MWLDTASDEFLRLVEAELFGVPFERRGLRAFLVEGSASLAEIDDAPAWAARFREALRLAPSGHRLAGEVRLTDGRLAAVYEDENGCQYVLDGDGSPVAGQWLRPPDEAVIVG